MKCIKPTKIIFGHKIPFGDRKYQSTFILCCTNHHLLINVLFFLSVKISKHPRTVLLTQNTNIQYKKACVYVYVVYIRVEDIGNQETCLQNFLVLEPLLNVTKKPSFIIFLFDDTHPTRRSGNELLNFVFGTTTHVVLWEGVAMAVFISGGGREYLASKVTEACRIFSRFRH